MSVVWLSYDVHTTMVDLNSRCGTTPHSLPVAVPSKQPHITYVVHLRLLGDGSATRRWTVEVYTLHENAVKVITELSLVTS